METLRTRLKPILWEPASSKSRVPKAEAQAVLEAAATIWNVTPRNILSRHRFEMMVEARQSCMAVLRNRGYSYEAAARAVAKEDHGTVMWAVKRTNEKLSWDKKFIARWVAFNRILEGLDYERTQSYSITIEAEMLKGTEDEKPVAVLAALTQMALARSEKLVRFKVEAADG